MNIFLYAISNRLDRPLDYHYRPSNIHTTPSGRDNIDCCASLTALQVKVKMFRPRFIEFGKDKNTMPPPLADGLQER